LAQAILAQGVDSHRPGLTPALSAWAPGHLIDSIMVRRRSSIGVFLIVVCVGAFHCMSHPRSAFVSAKAWTPGSTVGSAAPHRQRCTTATKAGKPLEERKVEEPNPMDKIKELGIAGTVSFVLWELAFWGIGGGGAAAVFIATTGYLPDFGNPTELAEVGGEAFVFINAARLLVPVRIALVISTAPWVDENVVQKFMPRDPECEDLSKK